MPPTLWAAPEQLQFLIEEDSKWKIIKSGSSTLKGFYTQMTEFFLKKWPITPDAATLEGDSSDAVKARQLAEERIYMVSTPVPIIFCLL